MIVRGNKTPRHSSISAVPGFFDAQKGEPVSEKYFLTPVQRAAIEKSLTPYIHLSCGHTVTREVATLYSVFASHIKDVYCENCDAFITITIDTEQASYPIHPLFLGYTGGNSSVT